MSARRLLVTTAVAGALVMTTASARAFCPSYTPAQTAGGQNCGVEPVPGQNPDIATWQSIFTKVSGGQASWGNDGPSIGTMGSGCGKPKPTTQVPAHFPCHVLFAIAMQETGWRQFCVPDTPSGSVGAPSRTIVSFDCGYGIGQVTSGMHVGETPTFDRARVAAEPVYNMATGTRILRDKWSATKCVGDNDPDVVEDWYTAIWAYNGLAYSNNPNNPNLTAGRGVYNPKNGGSYAYQERVLGWMEFPPDPRWSKLAAAYPNRGEIGTAGSPPDLSEPSCASPTDCTNKRATHASPCGGTPVVDAGVVDAATSDASDAGPPPPPPADEGCSCRAAPASPRYHFGTTLVVLAVALLLRRRARPSA